MSHLGFNTEQYQKYLQNVYSNYPTGVTPAPSREFESAPPISRKQTSGSQNVETFPEHLDEAEDRQYEDDQDQQGGRQRTESGKQDEDYVAPDQQEPQQHFNSEQGSFGGPADSKFIDHFEQGRPQGAQEQRIESQGQPQNAPLGQNVHGQNQGAQGQFQVKFGQNFQSQHQGAQGQFQTEAGQRQGAQGQRQGTQGQRKGVQGQRQGQFQVEQGNEQNVNGQGQFQDVNRQDLQGQPQHVQDQSQGRPQDIQDQPQRVQGRPQGVQGRPQGVLGVLDQTVFDQGHGVRGHGALGPNFFAPVQSQPPTQQNPTQGPIRKPTSKPEKPIIERFHVNSSIQLR